MDVKERRETKGKGGTKESVVIRVSVEIKEKGGIKEK